MWGVFSSKYWFLLKCVNYREVREVAVVRNKIRKLHRQYAYLQIEIGKFCEKRLARMYKKSLDSFIQVMMIKNCDVFCRRSTWRNEGILTLIIFTRHPRAERQLIKAVDNEDGTLLHAVDVFRSTLVLVNWNRARRQR